MTRFRKVDPGLPFKLHLRICKLFLSDNSSYKIKRPSFSDFPDKLLHMIYMASKCNPSFIDR